MTVTLHTYINNDIKEGVEMEMEGLSSDGRTHYTVRKIYEVGGQWNVEHTYKTTDRKQAKATFNRYKRAIEQ